MAANRVVIFEPSWNPSHDVEITFFKRKHKFQDLLIHFLQAQSISRAYRYGQKKPCFIYRFISSGAMEEQVFKRQVLKMATSKRVIDEYQVDRHYDEDDLNELYSTSNILPTCQQQFEMPEDEMLTELLDEHQAIVKNCEKHNLLLENNLHEDLSENEIQEAWIEIEEEKKKDKFMDLFTKTTNVKDLFSDTIFETGL